MRLLLKSVAAGLVITVSLTCAAFIADTRTVSCVFVWQACLLQTVLHTPSAAHEGSPVDLFAFAFGVLLGVPVYSLIIYALLARARKKASQA